MVDVARVLQILSSALNCLNSSLLSCFPTFVFFAATFSSILADYVRYVVAEIISHIRFQRSHSRLSRRRRVLRARLKLSLNPLLFRIGTVTGMILALFQDLVDHLSFEVVHVLVLQVLDRVTAHNLIAQFMFFLTDHQTSVLLIAVALVGDLLVPLKFFPDSLVQVLLLVVAEF